MSQIEQEALRILVKKQQDQEIVIKNCDKGAGIAVMGYTQYVDLCQEHLKETTPDGHNYYRKATAQDLKTSTDKITNLLKSALMEDIISPEEFKNMDPRDKGPGKLYMIPKVHKPHQPGHLPPVRPIISGCGSITEVSLILSITMLNILFLNWTLLFKILLTS